jgi:lysophospholipase
MLDHLVPPPPGLALPPGLAARRLEAADGLALRAAFARPDGAAKGTIVVLPGRAEFIEKYAEVLGHLLARGFAVAMLDWRGQGGSARQLRDPMKGHVEDYADYRLDLAALLDAAAAEAMPEPYGLLAHSTGGAIALSALARGENRFRRAILTAPLTGIAGISWPGTARVLTRLLASIGLSTRYVPGGGAKPIFAKPFEGNPLSSDPLRYAISGRWLAAEPRLAIGDPTIGWVDATFDALAEFQEPEFGRANRTPILMILAGADHVVETRVAAALAKRLKGAGAIELRGARHEILMEADAIQAQFWAAFDAFMRLAATDDAPRTAEDDPQPGPAGG